MTAPTYAPVAMKALSLDQPWASLVALGIKTIETRSWSTKYRGPLAIHATSKRLPMMHLPPYAHPRRRDDDEVPRFFVIDTITDPKHQRPHRTDIRDRVPKRSTTPTLFFPRRGPHGRPHVEGTPATEQGSAILLPLGALVATCLLVDVVPMIDATTPGDELPEGRHVAVSPNVLALATHDGSGNGTMLCIEDQRPYGDYRAGRFAWLLSDVVPIDPPLPARGRQQLWTWKPPQSVDEPDEAAAHNPHGRGRQGGA